MIDQKIGLDSNLLYKLDSVNKQKQIKLRHNHTLNLSQDFKVLETELTHEAGTSPMKQTLVVNDKNIFNHDLQVVTKVEKQATPDHYMKHNYSLVRLQADAA